MIYQGNFRTAQVMGDTSISSSMENYIPEYQKTFSGISRDKVVDQVLDAVKSTYNAVMMAMKGRQPGFTSDIAQKVADIVAMSNAAISVMMDMYGDTAFESVYPEKWKNLASMQEQTAENLKILTSWNPAVGDVTRDIINKRNAALELGDLDSPWVGLNMKSLIISEAYGRHGHKPVYDSIREKYLPSGEYRNPPSQPVKIYTQEERMKLIRGEFETAGVAFPGGGGAVTTETTETTGEKGPGMGLIAAAAAGVIAFFALR